MDKATEDHWRELASEPERRAGRFAKGGKPCSNPMTYTLREGGFKSLFSGRMRGRSRRKRGG